jgi:hypothetical protein
MRLRLEEGPREGNAFLPLTAGDRA